MGDGGLSRLRADRVEAGRGRAMINCEDCCFWDSDECHRMPPTVVAAADSINGGGTLMTVWPETEADDWCGEGKAQDEDHD